jgi:hypothetical protein
MTRPEGRYDTQFRIVITRTMKARLERAAKRDGIPQAEFARRALQERMSAVSSLATLPLRCRLVTAIGAVSSLAAFEFSTPAICMCE